MGSCYIEGNDVDALTNAEYISRVDRIPERGVVAEMTLRCEQDFKGYF